MRVHNTYDGRVHQRKEKDPPYAILSHTWDAKEQEFYEGQQIQNSFKFHIPTLLRMVLPGLLWLLITFLFYFLHVLAHIFFVHTSSLQLSNAVNNMQHSNIFYRARICIASPLYAWSQRLNDAAIKLLPKLSVLNDLRLSEKVRRACTIARDHHFSQLWVDTSCLDKTSSSELSEAINSMYAWYRDAAVCFVYLPDVPFHRDHFRRGSAFRHSRWFTRGWTLQELIAPSSVVFLSREWKIIGTKESLVDLIADITGIEQDVLMHRKQPQDVSVAARMSWVAERSTTKVEDQAYSLLGIFDIVMTPMYGEGMNAFRRLQQEILVQIPDDSIFAWESHVFDTPEMSDTQSASLSSDPENPHNHLIRLLDTATAQFVDLPEDKMVETPYSVLSHVHSKDDMHYDDLVKIQRNTRPSLIYVAIQLCLSTLLFLLCVSAFIVDYTPLRLAFRLWNWVAHLKKWTQRVCRASILSNPSLSSKIHNACSFARSRGHQLMWTNSSCVNPGNSAEVRKAILFTYAWFQNAAMCYVYLADATHTENPRAKDSSFRSSQWFTRCWTLQELVAPQAVTFLSKDWEVIGTKEELADLIEEITGIDRSVLTHRRLVNEVPVAERFSWAARRKTARKEDQAYCLLGLLDVTMTPRYEEGGWAFRRLREKILQRYPKEPLMLCEAKWHPCNVPEASRTLKLITNFLTPLPSALRQTNPRHALLAPSPRAFLFSGHIRSISRSSEYHNRLSTQDPPINILRHTYIPSPHGFCTSFHLIPLPESTVESPGKIKPRWYLVILSCEDSSFQDHEHLLARLCYGFPESNSSGVVLYTGEFSSDDGTTSLAPATNTVQGRTSLIRLPNPRDPASIPLAPATEERVYIPRIQYSLHFGMKIDWFGRKPPKVTKVIIQPWIRGMLQSRGYQIEYGTTGSRTPRTLDTISLSCMAIPLILRLKKGEQEAAIFLPVCEHPHNDYQYGWIIDDDQGTKKTVQCDVVPSSDPSFKTLTEPPRTWDNLPKLLGDMKERCASEPQKEWNIGGEMARPRVNFIAVGYYNLNIDVVQV